MLYCISFKSCKWKGVFKFPFALFFKDTFVQSQEYLLYGFKGAVIPYVTSLMPAWQCFGLRYVYSYCASVFAFCSLLYSWMREFFLKMKVSFNSSQLFSPLLKSKVLKMIGSLTSIKNVHLILVFGRLTKGFIQRSSNNITCLSIEMYALP